MSAIWIGVLLIAGTKVFLGQQAVRQTWEMTDGSLRAAMEMDLAQIQAVVVAAYEKYLLRMDRPPAPLGRDYAAAIEAGSIWVIGEPIVGLILLTQSDDALLVENVAVHPSVQGTGLGRELMAFAEHECESRRLRKLALHTNETMSENISIYSNLGYLEVERRTEDGYRRVFMEKRLPSPS